MKWNRRDWVLLLCVTLLAAGLRFYKLGQVPPGFQFDEAFNAIDAEQIWYGNRPLFLPANGGREALYSYFQAGLGTFLGFNVYSLRLASALAGIGAVAASYWLLRTILQRQAQAVALFTSLTLAISFWHLHFSHYGIRVIMMPLILSLLFGCYWLAQHGATGRTRWSALLVSGVLTGVTVWTHPSGRFVPFILIAYTGWLLWQHPERRRFTLTSPLGALVVTGGLAFLVFLPLGIEFYRHPDFFLGHASEVSIFAERVSGDTPWLALLHNIGRVLGMFTWHGDVEWAHNLAGRPVFDPLLALPFLIGVAIWLLRLLRRRADDPDVDALALLAIWSLVMLMPSVLSEAAPNYSRTLPSLPAIFLTVGLGLQWLVERCQQWRLPAWSGAVVASILLVGSGGWASYDFFVRFPQRQESYYAYDADKLDALAELERLAAEGYEVFLQPLWAEHATFTFLRSSATVKALDTAETLVLPPVEQGAVYAFPGEKVAEAQRLAELWPGVTAEEYHDRYDHPLLVLVKVAAPLLQDWPARFQPTQRSEIHFDDGPTLLGLQQQPTRPEVTLFWRAEQKSLRNLTTFLHFMDADGRRVAQVDKLPGNGSYLTPGWSPGERVIERYPFEVSDPCASGDTVDLVIGWYEFAANGQRRPLLDGSGDSATVGPLTLPVATYPPEGLSMPNPVKLTLSNDLQLLGYAIQTPDVKAGAPVTVDLYWATSAALRDQSIAIQLIQGDKRLPLWRDQVIAAGTASDALTDNQILCRRTRFTMPATLAPGNYLLDLASDTASVNFATLVVNP